MSWLVDPSVSPAGEARIDSLVGRIERAARRDHAVTFVLGGEEEVTSWGELHVQAKGYAAALQSWGIQTGDHVGLL